MATAAALNSAFTLTPRTGAIVESAIRTGRSGSIGLRSSGRLARTDSISAASFAVVVSDPLSAIPSQLLLPRSDGTTPVPGFIPNRPQHAAGIRMEPRPSLPWAMGTIAAATAAALPPDDPPVVRSGFQGLRAVPNRPSVVGQAESSGTFVLP